MVALLVPTKWVPVYIVRLQLALLGLLVAISISPLMFPKLIMKGLVPVPRPT